MKIILSEVRMIHARNIHSVDGGDALILEDDIDGDDGCFMVRLQSWDEEQDHPLMTSLAGKKIRIIIEVED